MNLLEVLQKAVKSGQASKDHLLAKNVEHTLAAVIHGETQKLYDSMTPGGRKMFLSFQNTPWNVTVEDETSAEDMYIKGVLEGMGAYLMMISIVTEAEDFKQKKEEETYDAASNE